MAVSPQLMRVDYANQLGRLGQTIGQGIQGYKRGQTQELAGQAMMGDPNAMEGLMMRDPAMAAQVQDRLSAQQAAQQQQEQAILGKLAEEKRDLFERLGGAASAEDFVQQASRAVEVGMYPTIQAMMGEDDQFDTEDYGIAQTFNQLTLEPEKKTGLIRDMDAMGLDPMTPEGQKFIRDYYEKAGGTNITIGGQGEGGFGADKGKFAEKLAEKQANQWEAQTEKAASAEENIAMADELETMLNNGLQTGVLAPARAGIDKFTDDAFGFSLTGMDPGKAERFEGISVKLARQMREPGEGEMTDSDAKAYQKVIGGLGTSVEANRAAIGAFKKAQQRSMEKAQEMDAWIEKTGTLTGFKDYWNRYMKQNPLFEAKKGDGGKPAAASEGPAVGTVQGGYVFLGGDPADPESWSKAR